VNCGEYIEEHDVYCKGELARDHHCEAQSCDPT
jgi:hypothetical protein